MEVEVGWVYKYVLIVVTFLVLVSFIAYMILGWRIPNPTDSQAKMLDWLSTLAKSGFGSFIGILVGKGLN